MQIITMGSHTLKPLLATMREKKRYLVFEVISRKKVTPLSKAAKAIAMSFASLHGQRGSSIAGLIYLGKRSDEDLQRGIIRVNRNSVQDLKAALTLVRDIDGQDVIARSVGVSGMLKKASEKFVAS